MLDPIGELSILGTVKLQTPERCFANEFLWRLALWATCFSEESVRVGGSGVGERCYDFSVHTVILLTKNSNSHSIVAE